MARCVTGSAVASRDARRQALVGLAISRRMRTFSLSARSVRLPARPLPRRRLPFRTRARCLQASDLPRPQLSQIVDECENAIRQVLPGASVARLERGGSFAAAGAPPSNVQVSAYSKCLPNLFPQHGPGRKHERRIELVDWQEELVPRHPERLLRGLIHSDGCRFMNTGRAWRYPRYSFSNRRRTSGRSSRRRAGFSGLRALTRRIPSTSREGRRRPARRVHRPEGVGASG